MFDQISVREGLLLAFVVLAYVPAKYVVEHIAASPSRRDITLPKQDLTWRTQAQLTRSLATLAALLGSAIFIYTPAAEQVARSPRLFPLLTLALGAWALFTALRGVAVGKIAPLLQGFSNIYERDTQPKRFWASFGWNTLLGGFCCWFGYQANVDAPRQLLRDQCYNEDKGHSPEVALAACNKLIADSASSPGQVADYIGALGVAHHQSGNFKQALSDYDEAIRRNPQDYHSHYNRGLVHQELGDIGRATADYSASIRLRPDDKDGYIQRGLIYLDTGKLDAAVADFTQAHRLRPHDPWPLANRGLAYVWKKDRARAERDFAAVRAIDATNPVLLRGEALMAMQSGKYQLAVQRLTAALNRDPKDEWSLRLRADAYRRLGEEEKHLADLDRLWELRTAARSQ